MLKNETSLTEILEEEGAESITQVFLLNITESNLNSALHLFEPNNLLLKHKLTTSPLQIENVDIYIQAHLSASDRDSFGEEMVCAT